MAAAPDSELIRFRTELWDSLRDTGPAEIGFGPDSYVGSAMETVMLRSAIRDGMTNENLLANLVFFKRHPERNGRLISREGDGAAFGTLSKEWLRIRDTQVRPLLAGTTPGAPTPARPVPYPGPGHLPLRDALVIVKRAETLRAANAGYRPAASERERIDSALARIRADPKYLVNATTYRVTFAEQPGRKVRIETIEDFVLFIEAVEAQYPAATAAQVVSEIRQIWFADEHWELLVASDGIVERGTKVDIENELNPIAKRFDMNDLAAPVPAGASGLCSRSGGRVIATSMGRVDLGHMMAGIDARLSGFPASNPHRGDPVAAFKYDMLKDFSNADPTAFATFAGDLGQAYAVFIFQRYDQKVATLTLRSTVAQCAKAPELLGDIHGYIAAAVAADARSSGASPTGTAVTASSIVRDLYLIDRSSSATTYLSYLEKVSGRQGRQLENYLSATSMSFAHLWYAKLNFDQYGYYWWPPELFSEYVREFSELDDRHTRTARPTETLDGIVAELLVTAGKQLR
jgi:hypothetical protein